MRFARFSRFVEAHSPDLTALSVLLLLVLAILAADAAQKADIARLQPMAVEIRAHPINFDPTKPSRTDFGRLEWRGGVALSAKTPFFGGYSGLSISADGKTILALSDSGSWLSARLAFGDGRVTGLEDARIGPLTQKDGQPIQSRYKRDAESLTAIKQGGLEGRYLIGFEGSHRIEEYVFEKGVMRGPVGGVKIPRELRGMDANQGLEGITVVRGGPYTGGLIAFAERKLSKQGNHSGALIKDGKSHPLYLTRNDAFDVTDLESLKDGSLLVLERSFIRSSLKLDIRLRLIPAKEIKPGAVLKGEVLLTADTRYGIDNFEAMAATERDGETLISLMSDDNFNFFQRTLLVQFALKRD